MRIFCNAKRFSHFSSKNNSVFDNVVSNKNNSVFDNKVSNKNNSVFDNVVSIYLKRDDVLTTSLGYGNDVFNNRPHVAE